MENGWVLPWGCSASNLPPAWGSEGVIDVSYRWHFKQAVLCNMRGAGEPSFEFDFPPGSDMMGTVQQGPHAEERMEAALFGRLHGLYDSPSVDS